MQPSAQLSNGSDVEEISLISELIDLGSWKIDNVRKIFIAPEADAILNIPLKCDGGEDFGAWSNTWSRDIACDSRFPDADRTKMITIMWAIWSSRNSWTHDKGIYDPI
jgi:hypothetical protein